MAENDIVLKEVDEILVNARDEVSSMFDEKARAEYLKSVASIYQTKVKLKELEQQERMQELELKNDKRKARGEIAVKAVDAGLRFAGTVAGIVIPAALYRICWNEGMQFEKEGMITSHTFKDHIRMLKLKF